MTDQLKRAISAAQTAQNNDSQAEATRIASSSAGDQTFDMSETSYKTSHTAIRKARRFAMQGLYEWLVTDHRFDTTGKLGWKANAPHDIAARTRATNAMHTVHIGYYHEMMRDIPEQIDALDALISQHLDREIDKLDTVEHAILLIGAYELQNRLEIPYKVVLDEAMKLNNHFGATDAHKLINAVLDRMAIELRDIEVQADTKANLRTSQKATAKQATTKQAEAKATDASEISATRNTEQPTASNKPRISASNTSVKRNRPNKPSAGTATKQVVIQQASDSVIAKENVSVAAEIAPSELNNVDKVETANNLETDTNTDRHIVALEAPMVDNSSVDDTRIEDQNTSKDDVANDTQGTTDAAEIGLADTMVVSSDSNETPVSHAEESTTDDASKD